MQEDRHVRDAAQNIAESTAPSYVLKAPFSARVLLGEVAHCAFRGAKLFVRG